MVDVFPKSKLELKVGLCSEAGENEVNEDCLGVRIPEDWLLRARGGAAAIADGVSAAEAGKEAAELSVKGFLNDFYDAPESWTQKTAGLRVLSSLNRWLFQLGQSRTSDGRGYVTTFSSVVFRGETGYLFHIGDSRIYRVREGELEQLTRDHSYRLGQKATGLARALGMDTHVEIDFQEIDIRLGDRIVLTTDGVHDFIHAGELLRILSSVADPELSSRTVIDAALSSGSNDNCSVVVVDIAATGVPTSGEQQRQFTRLPFPPDLAPGMKLDGYEVEKELSATSRSQAYLVRELGTGRQLVMKTPSRNYEDDLSYLERFVMESWIGKKLDSPQLAKAYQPIRGQTFLYTLLEYIEGDDLAAWIRKNSKPDIREVVRFAKQLSRALRAMHRQEMLHQDLKPSNVIIHPERGAVLIDFGSTRVEGIWEMRTSFDRDIPLGTAGYSAPEYFLERKPNLRSDLFSLGVIVYEALTGQTPYGERYERCQSVRDFSVLEYRSAVLFNSHVPVWLDGALRKAVAINPQLRYDTYSEFEYDIEHPNPKLMPNVNRPFMEKHPVAFWRAATVLLIIAEVLTIVWFNR